jgi:polyisoprenoid-binding protein YceI
MRKATNIALLAAGAAAFAPFLAHAAYQPPFQGTRESGLPGTLTPGAWLSQFTKDPAKTPSGTYNMSGAHTALFVKVPHGGGVSYSLFRFNKTSGRIVWNGADPAKSSANITVDVKSLTSNVPNFAEELVGDQYLKTAQFPTATFVSTAATRTGPTTGKLTGDFTLMGVTKPVTFDVTLTGASPSEAAVMNIGFNAVTRIRRSDFGFTTAMGPIGDEITITVDSEFAQPRPRKPLTAPAN